MGKQWTAHLIADFRHHDEIKEAVKKTVEESGITDPHEKISVWLKAVTAKYNSLPEATKTEYGVLADQWKKEGPPPEIKCWSVFLLQVSKFCSPIINGPSEATEKTGKYVQSVLEQLERALGVYALVLVAYQDDLGAVKISEYVYSKFSLADSDVYIVLNRGVYHRRIALNPPITMR